MKKILSVAILLSCIVYSTFALSAKIKHGGDYRMVVVYDDYGKVLEYKRPLVFNFNNHRLGNYYAISWYKEGATAEQIKEWKEFAKLFVEDN